MAYLILGTLLFTQLASANSISCKFLFQGGENNPYEQAMRSFNQFVMAPGHPWPVIDIHQFTQFHLTRKLRNPNPLDEPLDAIGNFVIKYKDGRVVSFLGEIESIAYNDGHLILYLSLNKQGSLKEKYDIQLDQVAESSVALTKMGDLRFKLKRGEIPQPALHFERGHPLRYDNDRGYAEAQKQVAEIFLRLQTDNPFFFRDGKGAVYPRPIPLEESLNLKNGQIAVLSYTSSIPVTRSGRLFPVIDPGHVSIISGTVVRTTAEQVVIRTRSGQEIPVDKKYIANLLIHDPSIESNLTEETTRKLSQALGPNIKSIYSNYQDLMSLVDRVRLAQTAITEYIQQLRIKTLDIFNFSHAVDNYRVKRGDILFITHAHVKPMDYSYVKSLQIQFLHISDRQARWGGPFLVGVIFPAGQLIEIPLVEIKSIHKVVDP